MHPVFEKTLAYIGSQCGYAGGAFAVVKDGEVVMEEVFGVASTETGRPITKDSFFHIASDTKCMTTSLISRLCDRGEMDWDAPVRTYIPEFHIRDDEYVSTHMTLKDMASHRSGICSNNALWQLPLETVPTRKAYMERVMNLAMAAPFRDRFMYQNELYGMLGYAAECVTGKSWEDLIREEIAAPLGMQVAFSGIPEELPDVAEPHWCRGKTVEHTQYAGWWPFNPCGGVRTNLRGFENWLKMWCSGGLMPNGDRFLSQAMFRKMITPISFWCWVAEPDACRTYALGLAPSVYRGEKLVYHGGSLNGYRSAMGFFPDKNCGYVVMINSNTQPLAVLKTLLCDYALGCLQDDYTDYCDRHIRAFYAPSTRGDSLPPVVPVAEDVKMRFIGTYDNEAYGNIRIVDGGENALTAEYHGVKWTARLRRIGEDGEYQFMEDTPMGYVVHLRFSPDGKNAKMSFSQFYTPNPFVKVE